MKVVLSDTSVLLNLLATECLAGIAAVTGYQFAICPAVRDEARKLRDARTGEMLDVDISPHIASGLLQVLEISGEEEQTLYVEQSIVVDDGEAMSIAIAAHRHLDLAIDDKQAANHVRRMFPLVQLRSTPEILRHWADVGRLDAKSLQNAIHLVEFRSRYFPAKTHPLANWWRLAKGSAPVE